MKKVWTGVAFLLVFAALTIVQAGLQKAAAQSASAAAPSFEVDPFWPKPLPNNWIIGDAPNVYVDAQDHIWLIHRPRTLAPDDIGAAAKPPTSECCIPAPPVIEFDMAGNVLQAWGGDGPGYDWPINEHGIFVDYKGNVWIAGNGNGDGAVLKFTSNGKFLLQIGTRDRIPAAPAGRGRGRGNAEAPAPAAPITPPDSNNPARFNKAANMYVYQKTNELFVADGYGNRRVIVFDADTGKYKRHWGAYGNKPDDKGWTRSLEGPAPTQFATMHAVTISNDGIVYASDRVNNRIQMFTPEGKFLREAFIQRSTLDNRGTAFEVAFSPDREQRWAFVPDGANYKVRILDRKSMQIVSSFGRHGRYAGNWVWLHGIATDSKGNLYTAESVGARLQKFNLKSARGTNP